MRARASEPSFGIVTSGLAYKPQEAPVEFATRGRVLHLTRMIRRHVREWPRRRERRHSGIGGHR